MRRGSSLRSVRRTVAILLGAVAVTAGSLVGISGVAFADACSVNLTSANCIRGDQAGANATAAGSGAGSGAGAGNVNNPSGTLRDNAHASGGGANAVNTTITPSQGSVTAEGVHSRAAPAAAQHSNVTSFVRTRQSFSNAAAVNYGTADARAAGPLTTHRCAKRQRETEISPVTSPGLVAILAFIRRTLDLPTC
jgi:hypothetical protein